MRKITADAVFPISSSPLQNGILVLDPDGRILELAPEGTYPAEELEPFHGILCPGLVNAHCHLELSYMKGHIPAGTGLVRFIRNLLRFRFGNPEANTPEIIEAALQQADEEMFLNGIVAVGDISNQTDSFRQKAASRLYYHTFVECFGSVADKAPNYFETSEAVFRSLRLLGLPGAISPHAPYSVPPALLKLIFNFPDHAPPVFSFHNQESPAEDEYFMSGTGDFVDSQKEFRFLEELMTPSGKSSLQTSLPHFPPDRNLLLVHNTMTREADYQWAMKQHARLWWCSCPRANLYIENRLPDYDLLLTRPERLCLGTDSLASNDRLSILEEMKTIQAHHPAIATETLLRSATLNGASFLQIDHRFGSLEPGKQPGVVCIGGLAAGTYAFSPSSTIQRVA